MEEIKMKTTSEKKSTTTTITTADETTITIDKNFPSLLISPQYWNDKKGKSEADRIWNEKWYNG